MLPIKRVVFLAVVMAWAPAHAQNIQFPTKPITVLMPFSAGGGIDNETRLYVQKTAANTGWTITMDYKTGAGGTLATNAVARAQSDGHTLLATTTSLVISPLAYKTLPYDTLKDLAPVTLMSKKPYLLMVHPSVPARTFKDYLNYLKQNPDKVSAGTASKGGLTHLANEWFHALSGTKVTLVHYKGGAQTYTDIIAGRIQEFMTNPLNALPHIRSGKLRVLAVSTQERTHLFPDIPTISESGFPEYDVSSWMGFLTTSGTSSQVIASLNGSFAKVAKDPDINKKLVADGNVSIGSTPDQFRQLISTELNRWKKVVDAAGIDLYE